MPAAVTSWEGPLFVVGMPRSGTKLFRGLLNRHARIRIPDAETEFLPWLADWVQTNGPPADEAAFRRLYRHIAGSTYFDYRTAASPEMSWQRWKASCAGRFDAADLFESFVRIEVGASRGDGAIWGDKSPAYIRHIALLQKHFPDSRIVHIVRDVRDYCLSIRKAWNKDILRAAQRWGSDVLEAHRQCLAAPSQCMEIHYEDLIASPEATMREVSRFLGLPFDEAITRLARPVENLGDATGRAEIIGSNARKFETAMSPAEVRAVESLAWDAMRATGYEPLHAMAQKRLPALSLRLRQLKDGVRLALRDAEGRGLARSILFHLSHHRTVR